MNALQGSSGNMYNFFVSALDLMLVDGLSSYYS